MKYPENNPKYMKSDIMLYVFVVVILGTIWSSTDEPTSFQEDQNLELTEKQLTDMEVRDTIKISMFLIGACLLVTLAAHVFGGVQIGGGLSPQVLAAIIRLAENTSDPEA